MTALIASFRRSWLRRALSMTSQLYGTTAARTDITQPSALRGRASADNRSPTTSLSMYAVIGTECQSRTEDWRFVLGPASFSGMPAPSYADTDGGWGPTRRASTPALSVASSPTTPVGCGARLSAT